MNFEFLNLLNKEKWLDCLLELPINQQDIYFMPEYYQIYQNYGDGEPVCFVFRKDKDFALYPFLKNSIASLKYNLDNEYFDIQGAYGYNGVISSSYDRKFINDFYTCFNEFCIRENIVAEFTRFHPLLNNYVFSEKHLTVIKDRQTVKLDLTKDQDSIWQNEYSKANRNKIRKAEKSNIQVLVSESDEDYESFYQIYSDTMKGVSAENYYFFDLDYFKNFKDLLGKNQKLLVAKYEGKVISALFLMIHGQYAHIHLSGSIYEYLNLGVNNLIKHEAVNLAKKLGAKYFHFGGGNTSNAEDHLFNFKANFSTERGDFYIGKKVHNQDIYSQLCEKWEQAYPEKKERYSKYLLKYRLIDN